MTNYIKIFLFLAALSMTGSANAAERDWRGDRMHQRGGGEMGTQVIEHLSRAVKRLDLSADQADAIHAELNSLRETIRPLAKEVHAGRKELRELVMSPEYDADAVAEIAQHQGNLAAEITVVASGAAAAVLAQLNDEQRAELAAMGEERRSHREEHRNEIKARKKERMDAHEDDVPKGD